MIKLSILLQEIKPLITETISFFDNNIENLALDYKKIIPNSMFFCVSKEEFVESDIVAPLQSYPQAIKLGAVVLISDQKTKLNLPENVTWIKVSNVYLAMALIAKKFYQSPFENTKIIGITGTNGKTTTNQLLDKLLSFFQQKRATAGTLGIMCQEKNIFTGLTTPFILDLYQHLASFSDLSYLVMEITSHASHFQRTASLEFDLLIFTNLTSDHLDFHLSWKNYKQSKLDYFYALAHQKKKAIALINKDDSTGAELIETMKKKVKIFTYSVRSQNADFSAKILKIDNIGSCYEIFAKENYLGKVHFPMIGLFNVYNSLAAFCACYLLGFPTDKIIQYLEKISQVTGRFEKIPNDYNRNIFVDYAHTSDSLQNVLTTIQTNFIKKSHKKLITVFGCGGERDKRKRPIMGEIATKWSDFVILTNDNPRNESSEQILKEIQSGIPKEKQKIVAVIPDRKQAIYTALQKATVKDVVLIAGKGHENYQIIGNKKNYFLDREVVLDFFQIKKNQ